MNILFHQIIQLREESLDNLENGFESLETRGIVQGFAFDHYSASQTVNLRFDCSEDKLETIRNELEHEVRPFVNNFNPRTVERLWDGEKIQNKYIEPMN